jgi:hypothetical protein
MNFSAVLSIFSSGGGSYRKGFGQEFIDLNDLTMIGELLCISLSVMGGRFYVLIRRQLQCRSPQLRFNEELAAL